MSYRKYCKHEKIKLWYNMNMYKGLRISSRLYNEKGLLVKISLFRNVAMFKTTHLVSLFSSSSIPELYDDLP